MMRYNFSYPNILGLEIPDQYATYIYEVKIALHNEDSFELIQNSLSTKTKEGLYIVIWYYNPEWDVKKEPVKISLECNSLPFKNISIIRSLIDDSHSNIINIVIEKGITGWPTDEELEELKRLNSLYEEREHKELEDGRYRYEAPPYTR